MTLRFITSGESHGKGLTGIIEGIPAGLELSADDVNKELARRQQGYGRGGRMKIETDAVEFLSGVRWGKTLGSPISLFIKNRDFANWSEGMSDEAKHEGSIDAVTRPRPGHADLSGALKYGHDDVRNVLERSSARETAMRVGLGAVCKKFLKEFNIEVGSYVAEVGRVSMSDIKGELPELAATAEGTDMRCPDADATVKMKALVDKAMNDGNSLGGIFVVFATGLPVGLGSHVQWDRKLDGRLAQALMSIQAIKGVEAGMGFEAARLSGAEVMDEISPEPIGESPFARTTNNAGGLEGGMTNGMPLVMRAAMKPIPTLRRALKSVDLATGEVMEAAYERSDVCAVPAASVIGESMVALVLAGAMIEKFGGDSIKEIKRNYKSYVDDIKRA